MPYTLTLSGGEGWDEYKNEFIYTEPKTVQLEHSLKAIAAWEGKYEKEFIGHELTSDEFMDYILFMVCDNSSVSRKDLMFLTQSNLEGILTYMKAPGCATKITEKQMRDAQRRAASKSKKGANVSRPKDVINAEMIYYYMIQAGIPFSCDTWNFNRLMALIQVCNIKEAGGSTMSKDELFNQNAKLNAARRAAMNSSG